MDVPDSDDDDKDNVDSETIGASVVGF